MISSRLLSSFRGLAVSGVPTPKLEQLSFLSAASLSPCLQYNSERYVHRDLRKSFRILKNMPTGPDKVLAPGVKHRGRIGEQFNYRRIVHYPEDEKYTIKKLPITKLGGRHPLTGRKIVEGIGGGSKQLWRWTDEHRLPKDWPKDGEDLLERVVALRYDPCRKPMLALVGHGENLRWLRAGATMKEGDVIRTSAKIPKNPVRPKDGDSYPLGALPLNTTVSQIEKYPGEGIGLLVDGQAEGKIVRRLGERIVVRMPNKFEYAFEPECQCVVGTVSIHPLKALPIGSPNRMRWIGNRPRSGLWQRKDGTKGRKVRALPPVRVMDGKEEPEETRIKMHHVGQGRRGERRGRHRKLDLGMW